MLQINSETAHKMFIQLMERFDKIEKMLERQNKMKECQLRPEQTAWRDSPYPCSLPPKETYPLLYD